MAIDPVRARRARRADPHASARSLRTRAFARRAARLRASRCCPLALMTAGAVVADRDELSPVDAAGARHAHALAVDRRSMPRRRGRGSSARVAARRRIRCSSARPGSLVASAWRARAERGRAARDGYAHDEPRCALQLRDVDKRFGATRDHSRRLARRRARRAPRDHRSQRRRQVDAVQPDQRPLRADAAARSGSTARRSPARAPFAINRRGLARSFQVTNIFPRLSRVREHPLQRAVVARLPLQFLAQRRHAARRQRSAPTRRWSRSA